MADDKSTIITDVKQYIADEFLSGPDADGLAEDTPLVTGGILDSISTMRLVTFLEERFNVSFKAHEMSADNLDTLEIIASTIASKQS